METKIKKIVVKVGTSTLTHGTGKPNLQRIDLLAKALSDLHNSGMSVVLVSSGAIAVGASKLRMEKKPAATAEKQAAAAVGQTELMNLYERAFAAYGTDVGQVLLTRDVTEDTVRKKNVINTLSTLLDYGVVPIVNENDSVSTEELEGLVFGDNDSLSATVAVLAEADLLVLLSDIDGLYDKDPAQPGARLIDTVEHIGDVSAYAGSAGSARGTGGMKTKLLAAQIAISNGIDMIIANGRDPSVLYDLVSGAPVPHTLFKAKEKK